MRLSIMVALALGAALVAPIGAYASEAAMAVHEPRIHRHDAVRPSIDPAATALASTTVIVPAAPALKRDDDSDGLSRNIEDCNRGCVGF